MTPSSPPPDLDLPGVGWIRKELGCLPLPPLVGDLIYIGSDAAGEHAASSVNVVTAVYAAMYGSAKWELGRRAVRQRFMSDGRRMAYKRLNDRQRKAALDGFLDSASQIDGLAVSLVFPKSIPHVWAPPGILAIWQGSVGLKGKWTHSAFERLMRTATLISLLIGTFGKDGQDVCWISDEDAIFATPERSADAARLMSQLANLHVRHQPGELGIGTVTIDPGDRAEEDLCAVSDLIGGALAEICTDMNSGETNRLQRWLSTNLSWKAQEVGGWIAKRHAGLRIATFMFENDGQNQLGVRRLDLEPSALWHP